MKALLMHRDRDFDLQRELPSNESALTQDLELDTLLGAMAGDDELLFEVARKALLSGLHNDVDTILYRQAILRDSLKNPEVVRELYDLAVAAIEGRKKHYFGYFSNYPSAILSGSLGALQMFMDILRKLRGVAEANVGRFESEGFTALFGMLESEIADDYLALIETHLTELKFRKGVLLSAELGRAGNGSINHVLRKPRGNTGNWLQRMLAKRPPAYTFRLDGRDEAGARILSDLRNRGINLVANALAQSADHVLGFFDMLRTELAFYVGCVNLHGRLAAKGVPMCFPRPEPAGERAHHFSGLRDACLALHMEQPVVGNVLSADRKSLAIITGPNQGGKSSFLRSIGLAQLMMHCGMFVAAESFRADVCGGLFTHYKREEDPTMKSGKLDEELARMSDIAEHVGPNSMLLFNESFAATNEREGSEIAGQIVRALMERRVKIFFVTHLYEFAHGFLDGRTEDAIFLRAERKADGTRTFRLVEGEPLETSYGEDVYRAVFAPGTDEVDSRGEQAGPRAMAVAAATRTARMG